MAAKSKKLFGGKAGTVPVKYIIAFLVAIMVFSLGYIGITNGYNLFSFLPEILLGRNAFENTDLAKAMECAYARCYQTCDTMKSIDVQCPDGSSDTCQCSTAYCTPYKDAAGKVCNDDAKMVPILVKVDNVVSVPSKFADFTEVQVPVKGDGNYIKGDGNFGRCALDREETGSNEGVILDYNDITSTQECPTTPWFGDLLHTHITTHMVKDECDVKSGTYYVWDETLSYWGNDWRTFSCDKLGGYPSQDKVVTLSEGSTTQFTLTKDSSQPSAIYQLEIPSGSSSVEDALIRVESTDKNSQDCGGNDHPIVDLTCSNGIKWRQIVCPGDRVNCGNFYVRFDKFGQQQGGTLSLIFTGKYMPLKQLAVCCSDDKWYKGSGCSSPLSIQSAYSCESGVEQTDVGSAIACEHECNAIGYLYGAMDAANICHCNTPS